jgi:hypothetical protein
MEQRMNKILNFPQVKTEDTYLIGTVIQNLGAEFYQIKVSTQPLTALRCASCLLESRAGDRVIVLNIAGENYLTQVITQAEDIKIIDAKKLQFNTNEFTLKAHKSTVSILELDIKVKRLFAHIPFLKALGERCFSYFKKTFIHSDALEQNIGTLSITTDFTQEIATTAKIIETPTLIQKTDVQHVNTQNLTINS